MAHVGSIDELRVELARSALRRSIVEEHFLRGDVTRLQTLRRDNPQAWLEMEVQRRANNRKLVDLNRQLRAAGCRTVTLEPSLGVRTKKLQRLIASNIAEIAGMNSEK